MLTNSAPEQTVTAHGKFLSRAGQKFFFKAMRLPDVSATLDFSQKLKLRKRLDDLKTAHTTGLLLSEAQAQPCLDLAAQSGLVAIVELRITSDGIRRSPATLSIAKSARTSFARAGLRMRGGESAQRSRRSRNSRRRLSSESKCVPRPGRFQFSKKISCTEKSRR